MKRRLIPLLCVLGLLAPAFCAAFEVEVTPLSPKPGDVVSVEVVGIDNPARAELLFRNRSYPFYTVAPGRMRALIGLTARDKVRWEGIRVVRKRFLLPDEVKTVGVELQPKKFSHQHLRMPKKKTRLAKKPEARKAIVLIRGTLKKQTPKQRWSGVFLRPAKGRRSSKYGHTRTINRKMSWDWHKGIDIAAADGHPVLAPNGGRIVLTGRFPVQGGTVIIDHGQGVMSAFLHLNAFDVEMGQEVEKGTRIATVGGGGFSTGSHLHWGVYVHGAAVDPEPLFEREL
jgi:lysostaphin